jgi:protein gp37
MGENSKIEWTDHTMNFWVGCTKVSAACDHCYAEAWAKRTGQSDLWRGARKRTTDANWRKPIRWNQVAIADGARPRVFTNSLADFFDNQIDESWRIDAWDVIRRTPVLTWLILTKRPQNIAKMLPPNWGDGWPNVWLGTTVENQEEADRRIPHLLAAPAKVRFLSCEPLLGEIDLTRVRHQLSGCPFMVSNALYAADSLNKGRPQTRIDWVIAGGESGPGARPMHPDWARSLRDQCAAAGVPFFFKQMTKKATIPDDLLVREWPNAA